MKGSFEKKIKLYSLPSSSSFLPPLGSDNPSSQYHPPQFCLSTRGRVVPYKYRNALLSEPIIYSS